MREALEEDQQRRLAEFCARGPQGNVMQETQVFFLSYMNPTGTKIDLLNNLIETASNPPAEVPAATPEA